MSKGVCAGIDVGGAAKGFHAVALAGSRIVDTCESRNCESVAAWCVQLEATFIAVDAPCRWSATGRARVAERALMEKGIWCFSSPTRAHALLHPRNHYGWMLAGEALYHALEKTHPLFDGKATGARMVLETFPHAVGCALAGKVVSARGKARSRRALLLEQGVDSRRLTNLDYVDAALCAVAAQYFAGRAFEAYGDDLEGVIVTPPWRCNGS